MPDAAPVILLAGTLDAIATAKSVLGPDFSYRTAMSVHEATSQLRSDIDLVLCNVAFDESRMFEFIQVVRSSLADGIVPILCFRHHERALSKSTHDAIELAVRTFERVAFIDLYSLSRAQGAAYAQSALRQAVLSEISTQVGAPFSRPLP